MSPLKDCGFFSDGKWIRAQMKHPAVAEGFPHIPAAPTGDLSWENKAAYNGQLCCSLFLLPLTLLFPFSYSLGARSPRRLLKHRNSSFLLLLPLRSSKSLKEDNTTPSLVSGNKSNVIDRHTGKEYGIWGPTHHQDPSRPLVNHLQSWHFPRNTGTGFYYPKIPKNLTGKINFFPILWLCYGWSPTIPRHTSPAPSVCLAEHNITLKQHLLVPSPFRRNHHYWSSLCLRSEEEQEVL